MWLARFYSRFWFATEFWLTPVNRRPYTFIFRDFMFRHVTITAILIFLFYAGMITLSVWHGTMSTIIMAFGSFLLAHLVWGTSWIEHQQEYPTYLGG